MASSVLEHGDESNGYVFTLFILTDIFYFVNSTQCSNKNVTSTAKLLSHSLLSFLFMSLSWIVCPIRGLNFVFCNIIERKGAIKLYLYLQMGATWRFEEAKRPNWYYV